MMYYPTLERKKFFSSPVHFAFCLKNVAILAALMLTETSYKHSAMQVAPCEQGVSFFGRIGAFLRQNTSFRVPNATRSKRGGTLAPCSPLAEHFGAPFLLFGTPLRLQNHLPEGEMYRLHLRMQYFVHQMNCTVVLAIHRGVRRCLVRRNGSFLRPSHALEG
jgi:hypothetical protein